jgi:hypothetical protein
VWPSLVALAAALALAVMLAYVSRSVSHPPVITRWEAEPAHVARNASTVLRVAASDPDGDVLRYEYKAERGRVAAGAGAPEEARYTPPSDGGTSDRVTVTVTDADGLAATATTSITTDALAPVASAPVPTTEVMPAAPPLVATAAPPVNVASPSAEPTAAVAARAPVPPPSPTAAAAPAAPRPNHAPVLAKGSTIDGLGTRSTVLAADGYDPDGDPIEYEWDTKGCFDILQQSQSSAEVKFNYCTWGVIRLTWKDPQGLSAFSEWTISK